MKSFEKHWSLKLFSKPLINIKLVITLFIIQVFSGFSQNNWIPTNGPYGASCNKLNLINNEVYCATSCGIFSTNNNGLSWTSRNNGLGSATNNYTTPNFQDIETINNKLIAGTYNAGIYISGDNGLTWSQSNTGLLDGSIMENLNLMILDIFINGNEILIGTCNGVFKSINQGQTWSPSNIGINEPNNVNALTFVASANSIFLQTGQDIYRSNDNGFTWLDLNNNFNATPFTLVANNTDLIVAGDLGIYKSINNGTSWSILSNDLPGIPSRIFESNNYLFCGIPNIGTYFSNNNGLNWNQISLEFYTDYLNVGSTHYLCNMDGVYSFGQSLSLVNCGLGAAAATNTLFVDGNDIFAGTDNGIYKSSDEGNLWTNMRTNLPISTNVKCITRSAGNLIIGTQDSGIFLSNNNGSTWTQSNNGLEINGMPCLLITMLHYSNGKIYAGARQNIIFYDYAGLFVSTDNGQSWTLVAGGLGNDILISSMTDFGQYLIMGTFNKGVYISTDGGDNWFFDGLLLSITDVAAKNNEYYAISGTKVYTTQNLGNTWTESLTGSNGTLNNIESLNSYVVIQGNYGHLAYLNNGNWIALGTIGLLGGSGATICEKMNGAIFTGSSAYTNSINGNVTYVQNGVSKFIGNPVGINENKVFAESIVLYPNPTSSEITITSDKFTNEHYTLYDQMGRTVGSGTLTGTSTTLSLSTLSKGIYILKVERAYESAIVVKE